MTNPFLGVRAALFDLDGTLIETHIDFGLMRREMLALAARYGAPAQNPHQDILGIVESARKWLVAEGKADSAAELRREAFARLQDIEVEHCGNPVKVPGARALLRMLRERGIRVGIVTRNCRLVSERLLQFGDLSYDSLLTRDDVLRTKPDPAHLAAALAALDPSSAIPNPAAVMVGDHWMDSAAGRAAGMRTIGLLRGRPESFYEPAPPDLLVPELADLLPLVEGIPLPAADRP